MGWRSICDCECEYCMGTGLDMPKLLSDYVSGLSEDDSCPYCENGIYKPIPCTVFDPFVGSGTMLLVARKLGRRGVGMDLSMDYLVNNARERLSLDRLEAWEEGGIDAEPNYHELPLFGGHEIEKEQDHKNMKVPGRQPHSFHVARLKKDR